MRWTVLRGGSLQRTPWRNGQGASRTIVTRLGRDGSLLWQVGLADLERDAPFSSYPECDRVFVPVAGGVPALSFEDGPFEPCPLLLPRRFAGERAVRVRVPAPGVALNVIADRRRCAAEVAVVRLEAGGGLQAPDAPEVLVHCLEGELSTAGDLVEPGDSLLGPGPAAPAAAARDTTAVVVAIRPSG